MNDRFKTLASLALVVAVMLAFFHETLFRGYSLVPTDIIHELTLPFCADKVHRSVQNHYAVDAVITDIGWGKFWQETVRSKQLPLWNPAICGGHPLQAEGMSTILSPFRLLFLVLPLERAFSLGIVLELVLASLFMWAFLRELGLSRWAAVFGALSYGLNSQFLMWYWRVPGTFSWAPLVLLLSERAFARDSRSCALGAGLVLGVAFLCGSIQASFHLGCLCLIWFVGSLYWRENAGRRRVGVHAVLIFLIAALISAVQWLPTLELMRLDAWGSAGARGPHPEWKQRLLQIPALVQFAIPALTGSTESYDLLKAVGASRMDFTGYIGLLGFAAAWIGGMACRGRRPVRILLTLAAVVLFILLATPLVRYVYHRFLIVVVFAAAGLSAYGLDALRSGDSCSQASTRRVFRGLGVVCLGLIVLLLVVQGVVGWQRPRLEEACWKHVVGAGHSAAFPHRTDWFRVRVGDLLDHYRATNPAFAIPVGCFLVAVGAWGAGRRGWIRPGVIAPAIVLLNSMDLVGTGREWVPQVPLDRYPLVPAHPVLDRIREDPEGGRLVRLGGHSSWILRPNFLMLYGLDDLQGNFSLAPENVGRLAEGGAVPPGDVLDLANVRFLLTEEDYRLPKGRLELSWKGDGICLYRNPTCRARLQFFSEWTLIPDHKDMWKSMKSGDVDVSTILLLEKEPFGAGRGRTEARLPWRDGSLRSEVGGPRSGGKPEKRTEVGDRRSGKTDLGTQTSDFEARSEGRQTGNARRETRGKGAETVRDAVLRLVEDTPLRVRAEVDAPVAGFVLLADTFYPGWKACLDGREVEVLRADQFFRAVAVGPGYHDLVFRFQPASFLAGLAVTFGGLGLIATGMAWEWMRARRRGRSKV